MQWVFMNFWNEKNVRERESSFWCKLLESVAYNVEAFSAATDGSLCSSQGISDRLVDATHFSFEKKLNRAAPLQGQDRKSANGVTMWLNGLFSKLYFEELIK